MKFRFAALAVMIAVVSLGSGCVSTGTYQAKEQESLQLSKSLEESKTVNSEIIDKNAKLTAETEALRDKLKKLDSEFAILKEESTRLKDENAKLVEAVKPENLLKALAGSLATLQNENSKLKLALENAEKMVKSSPEPLKITPDIAKPAQVEEKKVEEKAAPGSKEEPLKSEPADAEQKTPATAPKSE